jgi:ribosomal protein S6--L-glutamate ligase
VRIALLLVRHPPGRPSPIFPEVARRLDEAGATVDLIYPDDTALDLARVRVEHDLYVLKSGSETALSLAGALDGLGARILNPYPVAAACRNKVVASKLLEAAGVPTPRTYVAAAPDRLAPLLDEGPVVVKPVRGSQGRGVAVVRSRDELEAWDGGVPVLAQRYHEPDGLDRKLYRIGADVFCVERPWPVRSYEDKLGRPIAVGRELRELTDRCARALGVDLFGFDVVLSRGLPYVVDVSSFPGFKGVPEAPRRLAGYILEAAERARRGRPLTRVA